MEMREAARFNGYTWRDWQERSHDERVFDVAYARVARLIDSHAQDAAQREMEAESKKKGRARGR